MVLRQAKLNRAVGLKTINPKISQLQNVFAGTGNKFSRSRVGLPKTVCVRTAYHNLRRRITLQRKLEVRKAQQLSRLTPECESS